jgi:hypothetical protein
VSIILPALSVAFAAFCIWLTVRVVNWRERWAKWTLAVAVGPPLLYVASFGPACRWIPESYLSRIYQPCETLALDGPAQIRKPIRWYVNACGGGSYLQRLEFQRRDLDLKSLKADNSIVEENIPD